MEAQPINQNLERVPRCITCGYALLGLESNRCPECGREFEPGNLRTVSLKPPYVGWWYWTPGVFVFHTDIRIAGGTPRAGAELTMTHGLAGIRVTRIGRILWWREGVGYSFSDLSRRGPRYGFPHVFSYRITHPTSAKPDTACTLIILVRGRWTARLVPRALAWLWLKWVFSRVVHNVENNFLVYRIWRRGRKHDGPADRHTATGP